MSLEVSGKTETIKKVLPSLFAGDRLTGPEFELRYSIKSDLKKAELIEGVVYMPSSVSTTEHAAPHFNVVTWLGIYQAYTPEVQGADSGMVRLDLDNRPQPDACLRILPEYGGQTRTGADGYIEHAPELVFEVAASVASHELYDKMNAYRRNGVCEYIVWRVLDHQIDWFVLRDGRYHRAELTSDGLFVSEFFPGLWLDADALLSNDMARVVQVVQHGVASSEHESFSNTLRQRFAALPEG